MSIKFPKPELQKVKLTDKQLHLMLHSLGLNRGEVSYRNYFFAGKTHIDYCDLELLVKKGYMVRRDSTISPDIVYQVTAAGKEALRALGVVFNETD